MITVLNHPMVHHNLSLMRDINGDQRIFRKSLDIISHHLAVAAGEDLPLKQTPVNRPSGEITCFSIPDEIIIIPILPYGIELEHAFKNLMPMAKIGLAGYVSDGTSTSTGDHYFHIPALTPGTKVFIVDIVLGNGDIFVTLLNRLQLMGCNDVSVCSVLGAPEGIEQIRSEFRNVKIFIASLEDGIDKNGNALPGFGSIMDRLHG